MSNRPHRLPDDVVPHRYDLVLEPDLAQASFNGTVTISVHVERATDQVVLHALDLEIDAANVRVGDQEHTATVGLDAEHEMATLSLPSVLPEGPAELRLSFRGVLNDQLLGFYRSTFTSVDPATGESTESTLAVTQFESTHARRAFPCFDEPAFKAVFAVTLVVPRDQFVVANTAEVERSDAGDGRVRVRFADTISMSTYLVAFVIGPLEATEARMVDGIDGPIPLRVVYPPGNAHLCGFALDVAEAGLRFYEEYYGLPYPGDKVDLVAVPDFAFGAMENLGCITFREVLLLVDPERSTQPELQRVADVINHELAHMWFGDLVTMSWWNGIWLNEAFATFMEVMATDAFRPDWDVWTTFGLARAAAFDTDTLHATRPIEYEVVTAADAEGMFDILTYEKGASVVRMLEQYLGPKVFRDGIGSYLRRHAYGNTETSDLWVALEEASGEPVRRIMDSWIFRGGHPVVRVERVGDRTLGLGQTRASYDDTAESERWPIPMVLDVGAPDGELRRLLDAATTIELPERADFVQANVGGAGFYRVELDAELRLALLDHGEPGPLERFVLLDDTWAGYLAGRVPLDEVIDLLRRAASDELDPSVWRRLAGACRELVRLSGPDHADGARALVASMVVPALARVEAAIESAGTDGADRSGADRTERLREVRGVLFALAGADAADPTTRQRARELFQDTTVDATLQAAAINVVAASATNEEHATLEAAWRDATTPQDELRYLNALVDTDDIGRFTHTLELAATEVRTQNAPYLLRRAIDHPTLGPAAWDFVSSRWHELTERFPSNSLPRMLEGVRGITDPATAEAVTEFLASHPTPSGTTQVTQHLERMQVEVHAAARTRQELERSPGLLSADHGT
ncbi:MAG: M1 family aminopeptidase [Microthrixaceae bacterium]